MPLRVLLLRHAETASPGVFHGAESDVGLSERGVRQAEAVAAVVAGLAPTRLVSSAMRRARDTAAPIARLCGLPVQTEPDLHERAIGALCGQPTRGRDGVWPDTLERWLAGDTRYAPPGAESYEDIKARVMPVWQRLTSAQDDGTLTVVAHGVVCRVLLTSILPELSLRSWHDLQIRNASITELVGSNGTWRAVRIAELPPSVASL